MATQEYTTEKVNEGDYSKSDKFSAEDASVIAPEGRLKRQLKNRHVAMIRSV